jgi:hypothetical protein
VARAVWPYDAEGDGHSVRIVFESANGAGVADESVQMILNGEAVRRELAEFDPLRQTLSVDLNKLALLPLTKGAALEVKLLGFHDRAGIPGVPFTASNVFDLQAALKAAKPAAPPLITVEMAGGTDFMVPGKAPLALSEIVPAQPAARLQQSTAAPSWASAGQRRSYERAIKRCNDGYTESEGTLSRAMAAGCRATLAQSYAHKFGKPRPR